MKRSVVMLIVALLVLGAGAARAASIIEWNGTSVARTGTFTIGARILVGGSDIEISELGVHDFNQDGIPAAGMYVAIWADATATVVADGTVPQGATLEADGYRYVALGSTVTLSANTYYVIGAYVGAEGFVDTDQADPTGDFAFTGANGVSFIENRFASGTAKPTSSGGGTLGRWCAATAKIQQDIIPPEWTLLNPADDSTVPTPASLTVTFNEDITTNTTGSITISNMTAHTVHIIPMGSSEVSVTTSKLTITPSPALANGTEYAVLIDTNAIKDLAGNFFAGITNDTTWNFTTTTPDTTAPTIVPGTFSPTDGASGLQSDARNFSVTFSENITAGSGSIVISNLTDGTALSIPANDSQVTISTSNLTVTLDGYLLGSKAYAILIETNAIKDDPAGNYFAGITDTTTWNFNTAARVNWTPAELEVAPAAWFDASEAGTITDSGGSVSEWADMTTNAYHLVPGNSPTTASATIGGLNAIRFDGVNDYLYNHSIAGLLNTDVTIATVVTVPTLALHKYVLCGRGDSPTGRWYLTGGGGNTFAFNVNVSESWTASAGAHIVVMQRTTNDLAKAWMDGTLETTLSPSWGNYSQFFVGSLGTANYGDFDMGETVIIPTELSLDDQQRLEGYLAWKWALQGSLPSGHPYENAPPPAHVGRGTIFIFR